MRGLETHWALHGTTDFHLSANNGATHGCTTENVHCITSCQIRHMHAHACICSRAKITLVILEVLEQDVKFVFNLLRLFNFLFMSLHVCCTVFNRGNRLEALDSSIHYYSIEPMSIFHTSSAGKGLIITLLIPRSFSTQLCVFLVVGEVLL